VEPTGSVCRMSRIPSFQKWWTRSMKETLLLCCCWYILERDPSPIEACRPSRGPFRKKRDKKRKKKYDSDSFVSQLQCSLSFIHKFSSLHLLVSHGLLSFVDRWIAVQICVYEWGTVSSLSFWFNLDIRFCRSGVRGGSGEI
jgi:hypothetical protein